MLRLLVGHTATPSFTYTTCGTPNATAGFGMGTSAAAPCAAVVSLDSDPNQGRKVAFKCPLVLAEEGQVHPLCFSDVAHGQGRATPCNAKCVHSRGGTAWPPVWHSL
jgi:hypothetical protein